MKSPGWDIIRSVVALLQGDRNRQVQHVMPRPCHNEVERSSLEADTMFLNFSVSKMKNKYTFFINYPAPGMSSKRSMPDFSGSESLHPIKVWRLSGKGFNHKVRLNSTIHSKRGEEGERDKEEVWKHFLQKEDKKEPNTFMVFTELKGEPHSQTA